MAVPITALLTLWEVALVWFFASGLLEGYRYTVNSYLSTEVFVEGCACVLCGRCGISAQAAAGQSVPLTGCLPGPGRGATRPPTTQHLPGDQVRQPHL